MPWMPEPQATWVAEANRGERPEFEPAHGVFEPEALMAEAAARNAGRDLSASDMVEPLRVICHALETTADLTPLGRWATQRYLRRLLDVRLLLDQYLEDDPGVEHERIDGPVFVVGAPRTGTTALHRLLGADPAHRVPEGWEFAMPVPPPEPDTFETDPRIESTADELMYPQAVATGLRAIHTYSARMPKECLSAMAFSLRSEELISRYNVPAYVEWLRTADMGPAYAIHMRVLQVLQRRMESRRWVCKSPVHLQSIPEVVARYPDARFVITHRDPAAILGSVSSLVATVRSAFSDTVDPVAIGRYHLDLYGRSLDELVDHVDTGTLPPDRTVHVRHDKLVNEPLATVRRVYDGLSLPFSRDADTAVRAVVDTSRDDAIGAHRYRLTDFGLDMNDCDEAFRRYRSRFLGAARHD